MSSLFSRLARAATIIALASPALAAQAPAAPRTLCFTPDVAAHCKRFVLLESNMAFHSPPQSVYPNESPIHGSLSWGLGAMQNVSDRTAVGAVVASGFNGSDASRTTVELRAIRWLPNSLALEGSAGYMQLNAPGAIAHGATTGIALTYRDLIGVTANLQSVGLHRQQSALLIGVRTGSWVTPIATGILFGTVAIALANANWN